MICPKCGHENSGDSLDCLKCGIIFAKYNPSNHISKPETSKEKTCPFCLERIKEKSLKCHFCGEWLTAAKSDDIDQSINMKYFLSGLFDFSLKQLITPGLIRAQYATLLLVFTISEFITFFISILKKSFAMALGSLLIYFLMILMGRLRSELMMVAFKVEVNTRPQKGI